MAATEDTPAPDGIMVTLPAAAMRPFPGTNARTGRPQVTLVVTTSMPATTTGDYWLAFSIDLELAEYLADVLPGQLREVLEMLPDPES